MIRHPRLFLAGVAMLAIASLMPQSCATKAPPAVDYVVDGVVECAKAGVHEVAVNLIDDAASALATGDWQSALLNLVKQFGEGAVDCAVAEVADTAGKHAALNELEATKARRAKEWLASRPVKVSGICCGCGVKLAGICAGCGRSGG